MQKGTDQSFDHIFKIVLIGDAAVGKTCLLNRYIKGTVPKQSAPTIGVEFATRIVELESGVMVKAQLWDTAGQEKYRAMTAAHYRKALGGMVVYDITKATTYEDAERWIKELRAHSEPNINILLVGNKLDIVQNNPGLRQVDKAVAEKYATQNKMLFIETSALDDINVKTAFEKLLQHILEEATADEYLNERRARPAITLASQQVDSTSINQCC